VVVVTKPTKSRKRRTDERKKTRGKAQKIISARRTEEAVQYDLQGYAYSDIGKALGISKTRAFQIVEAAYAEAAEARRARSGALLEQELQKLDLMTIPIAKVAYGGDDGTKIDQQAQEMMHAIHDRRVKLTGIAAPTRTDSTLSGKDGAPPIGIKESVDDASKRFVSKVLSAVAAATVERALGEPDGGGEGGSTL
jgi:hypothetical protein